MEDSRQPDDAAAPAKGTDSPAAAPVMEKSPPPKGAPALTISIHSWVTPAVALVALLVGFAGGYLARPYLSGGGGGGADPAPAAAGPVATAEPVDAAAALPETPPADAEARRQVLMDALIAQTRHFKGDADAPVTILEFSDFQCPYCGRFFAQVGPEINRQYIETGKARLGYIHFAFLGPESLWSAEASECAADQDAFWEYHDKLFNNQNGENKGAFSKENLKGFAADLGLDMEAFNQCLDGGVYTEYVQSQVDFGRQIGVQSTPTFLVNGIPVVGAQPFDAFQQAIEASLEQ